MKIQDAVQHMTKLYLRWIVDSYTEDIPPKEEEEARTDIIEHVDDLADLERLKKRITQNQDNFEQFILRNFVLESILNQDDLTHTIEGVSQGVRQREKEIIQSAEDPGYFDHIDDESINTLKTVLQVAFEDEKLSQDEIRLITKLREKLGLREIDQYRLHAQLGHFPKKENRLHTYGEVEDELQDLQKVGVVFYCNQHPDGSRYVIPEELEKGAKEAIGFELSRKAWDLLLQKVKKDQIRMVLRENGASVSGTKDELIDRTIRIGIEPSSFLSYLKDNELYELLGTLPGAKVSGSKSEKIKRVVDYFANRTIHEVDDETDEREIYYKYLTELANRDRENLHANDVIGKDKDIDNAFEKGTRYLFEEKFGLELMDLDGSERPDGAVYLEDKNEVLMWDNKSKEGEYTFPDSHVNQFNKYIRKSDIRVTTFLVITSDINDDASKRAIELKARSKYDTDVALISAENLDWLADNWKEYGSEFNPYVFNTNSVLDIQSIKARLEALM